MMSEDVRLVAPSEEWRDAYESLNRECRTDAGLPTSGFSFTPLEDFSKFGDLVRELSDQSGGVGLKPGWVPQTTYWAIVGTRIVGISRLRHYLTPELERHAGHIGYMVRLSERRKGYGRAILALTLERARERGLTRVLLTCDTVNEGSAGVILGNGGVEAEPYSPDERRFWITL